MTSTQKIIKYIATAFAILLAVTIISAILTGGYVLLNSLGLIDTNNAVITEDLKTISSDIAEVSSLKIDLAYTNLYIKSGEKEDYTIKASKGLGNVTLDGQTIESDKVYGNGKKLFRN